jgi:hypothetical protein
MVKAALNDDLNNVEYNNGLIWNPLHFRKI